MDWTREYRETGLQGVVERFCSSISILPILNIKVRAQELNVKSTYLTNQSFLRLLPKTSNGSVITVGSMAADLISPRESSYALKKSALNRFNEFVTLENPNVRAVVFHPGTVLTLILDDFSKACPFPLDARK